MRQHTIAGIDIGNSFVKTVIASVDQGSLRPQIIGTGKTNSNGLRRGVVFDLEETIKDIGESVRQAEATAGVKVKRAYVSIGGLHVKTQTSKGVIVVSRADNEITHSDIQRVIDAASTINLPPNREIVHVIPRDFIIDSQERVKNALGMKGVRLEAEVLLIEGLSSYIRNLAKAVNENGIEVIEFVFAPLAAAKSILDKHQREYGVLSLDFGGGTSSLVLFHEGDIIHTAILPIGSKHITHDIAVALQTSIENAEKIKQELGLAFYDEKGKKDQIDLSDLISEGSFIVSRKHIARIIDSRVSELFDLISQELKKMPRSFLIPSGAILAGGGSNLVGVLNFARERLKLATKVSADRFIEGPSDQISDPAFAVAAGLVAWGFEKEFPGSGSSSYVSAGMARTVDKIKKWLKNFTP